MPNATPTDVLVGAAAGVIATVPMTIVMEELHRVLPGEHDGPLPPREVTEGLYDHLGADDHVGERRRARSASAPNGGAAAIRWLRP